jgi:multimeric flavodoxin WrbA
VRPAYPAIALYGTGEPLLQTLLIVYHSMTGGTRQMAAAALRGAGQEAGVRAVMLHAPDAQPADVLGADGYIFATPENLASMSGLMKDFFDRTYYAALDQVNARPYAAMVCAGSDGEGAIRQLERIALGWRLKPVAPALLVITQAQSPEDILRPKVIAATDLQRCEELGATLAAGLAMGLY